MLRRILGVTPDALDTSTFERLVSDGVPEGQRIEFKSTLPGSTKDERQEFARDVAAMANGGGGLLLFGIGEGSDALGDYE